MLCMGLEPRAAGWKVQTNPLRYGGTHCYAVLEVKHFDYMLQVTSLVFTK